MKNYILLIICTISFTLSIVSLNKTQKLLKRTKTEGACLELVDRFDLIVSGQSFKDTHSQIENLVSKCADIIEKHQ